MSHFTEDDLIKAHLFDEVHETRLPQRSGSSYGGGDSGDKRERQSMSKSSRSKSRGHSKSSASSSGARYSASTAETDSFNTPLRKNNRGSESVRSRNGARTIATRREAADNEFDSDSDSDIEYDSSSRARSRKRSKSSILSKIRDTNETMTFKKHIKLLILLFIFYIIIHSSYMVHYFAKYGLANNTALASTTKGGLIQFTLLAVVYVLGFVLISYDIL